MNEARTTGSSGLRSTAVLSVVGMSCGGCAARVEGRLLRITGVHQAQVDLPGARAVVEYDPARVQPEQLSATLTAAGYEAAVAA